MQLAKTGYLSLPLLAATALLTSAAASPAQLTATGTSLAVDLPCVHHVSIQPDPSLSGQVVMAAQAAHPEELAQLAFDSGTTAKLHVATEQCWRPAGNWGFSPTLDVTLRVPAAFPISLDASGDGTYQLGDVGKLTIDLSGGADILVASATGLQLDLSGGGDIKIHQVKGPTAIDLSGGGALNIGDLDAPNLALQLSGGGDINVTGGNVATMSLDVSGAGKVRIGATVGNATVDISGVGDVSIAKVTGALSKDVSGVGSVRIGD